MPGIYNPTIPRRSKQHQYQPMIWDHDIFESLNSRFTGEDSNQTDKLTADVRAAIGSTVGSLAQLELINALQRSGLLIFLRKKSTEFLIKLTHAETSYLTTDLYATALAYRILRRHGIQVSQGMKQKHVFVPGGNKEDQALDFDVFNQGMTKTELCNKCMIGCKLSLSMVGRNIQFHDHFGGISVHINSNAGMKQIYPEVHSEETSTRSFRTPSAVPAS